MMMRFKTQLNSRFAFACLFTGLLSSPGQVFSQFCTGSLGDPVVNLDFGNSAGNSGFTPPPGYVYISSSCPDDGYYTITTSTSGCFSNAWHTINTDHTGNGAFMLVNASHQPSDFFLATVSGLCPNTTYEFSAWIMNVLLSPSGIKPNLTFTIETIPGTILNTFSTGDIPVSAMPAWLPYRFYFSTNSSISSVVLRIKNNAPGGIGNDLALDDIVFRPCGPQLVTSIQGHPNKVDVCVDNQPLYVFNAVASPGFAVPVYQWQLSSDSARTWTDITGANGLTYTRSVSLSGNYWYRLTVAESGNAGNSSCRISSNRLEINVERRPQISAGPDRVILAGGQAMLNAVVADPNLVLSWSPPDHLSDVTSLTPIANPSQDTYYTLSAISGTGCANTDQVSVKVVKDIFVPTAFTPNNDGKNDRWRIPFLDPGWGAQVSVYNRYGNLVYHVSGYVDWDGKLNGILQATGSFVYFLEFPGIRGVRKGVLQLIR